jgi:hypothetical protein
VEIGSGDKGGPALSTTVRGLRSQTAAPPCGKKLPSDGQCYAARYYSLSVTLPTLLAERYSLNATPLNDATPGALDVAT